MNPLRQQGRNATRSMNRGDSFGAAHIPSDAKFADGYDRRGMPIPDHAYHSKSDAELDYIIKDAHEAAEANHPKHGGDPKVHSKYLDQVNDAHTVKAYRRNNAIWGARPAKKQAEGDVKLAAAVQGAAATDPAAGRRKELESYFSDRVEHGVDDAPSGVRPEHHSALTKYGYYPRHTENGQTHYKHASGENSAVHNHKTGKTTLLHKGKSISPSGGHSSLSDAHMERSNVPYGMKLSTHQHLVDRGFKHAYSRGESQKDSSHVYHHTKHPTSVTVTEHGHINVSTRHSAKTHGGLKGLLDKHGEGKFSDDAGIQNPNSSGQGHHPGHANNPYHETITKAGWKYSHSTPVTVGGVKGVNHTYKHPSADHNVSARKGADGLWRWAASHGGSGSEIRGTGPTHLEAYLKRKASALKAGGKS